MVTRIDADKNFDNRDRSDTTSASNHAGGIVPDDANTPISAPSSVSNDGSVTDKLSSVRSKIRSKTIRSAIALSTLPLLITSGVIYANANRSLNQQISASHQQNTEGLAAGLAQFMAERYSDIQALSTLPFLTTPQLRDGTSVASQQATLKQLLATYQVYDNIAVFNVNGNPILQTGTESLPNQETKQYFQQVLQTKEPVVTQPLAGSDGTLKIYFLAPIREGTSQSVIGVVQTSLPVSVLETRLQAAGNAQDQYQIFDATGKFFIAEPAERLGRSARTDFPQIEWAGAASDGSAGITSDTLSQKTALVSQVPLPSREGLPDLKWGVIAQTDATTALASQRSLLLQFLLGGGLTTLLAGATAAWLANRATRSLLKTVQMLQQVTNGRLDSRLVVQGKDEFAMVGNAINQMAEQLQALQLSQAETAKRTQLVADLTSNIRQTLEFDTILRTSVEAVRQVLDVDRTVIYRFNADFTSGEITAESVRGSWARALGQTIHDPLLPDSVARYKSGRVTMVENLETANLSRCHCEILERLDVKANIVAPILVGEELVGLICAHQCSGPRYWNQSEIELIQQLSVQIGYALEQAAALKLQSDTALRERQQSAIVSQMRESLDEATIMEAAVRETRAALSSDRVLVYLFDERWAGTVVAESVDRQFATALGAEIADPCFADGYIGKYQKGRVQATNNILEAGLTECHLRQLKTFDVRANLVAPILVNDQLKGLFVAHQCAAPRMWSALDINFMRQVAIQLGFALEQAAALKQQSDTALRERQQSAIVSQMRELLDEETIMQVAVRETRAALASDRVLVYLFDETWSGTVMAESVDRQFPTALGAAITDPCFADGYIGKYQKGRVQATNNILEAGLTECHLMQLKPFDVKANLVAPILANDQLKGLFVAHQCAAPRMWSELDINFMRQVAIQLGFALEQAALTQQQRRGAEQAYRLKDIMVSMRQSLKRKDIYTATVDKLRQALKADRVVIYQFNPDWSGTIIAESVASGWRKILNQTVNDPFREGLIDEYRNGRVRAMNDVASEVIADCHRDILEGFEIRASIVAPLLRRGELLGLVSLHQCSGARFWQDEEINLVAQLSTQLTFALEQSDLFEEKEKARLQAEAISQEQSRQREALQMQLVTLLSDVEGVAQGDLTVRADVTAGDIGTVADFFNSIVENLRQIVTQVKISATQVNLSLGENEGAMRHLAEEALRQAKETTYTLDSVEAMTQSIQAVAVSAQQAATVARKVSTTAEAGENAIARTVENIMNLRETVGETAKKVKRLGESSQQISKVVSLINQIAMQTNLLAINAGIEAARAGEEGQGFAVVAEEVGELAARSAAATQEIEKIVENIQRETGQVVEAMEQSTAQVVEGTHLVDDAKRSLHQILDVSHQIDQLVQSISNATVSQVETSESVSRLMKQIAQVSESTSDSSRQVSSSLRKTVAVAQELQASVGTFKVDSDS